MTTPRPQEPFVLPDVLGQILTGASQQMAKELYGKAAGGETVSDIAGRRYAELTFGRQIAQAMSPSDIHAAYHSALVSPDPETFRRAAVQSIIQSREEVTDRRRRFRGTRRFQGRPTKRQRIVRDALKAGLVSRDRAGRIRRFDPAVRRKLQQLERQEKKAEQKKRQEREKRFKRKLKGFALRARKR